VVNFSPEGVWEYILWPLIFSLDGQRVNLLAYRDVRFALLYFDAWLITESSRLTFPIIEIIIKHIIAKSGGS
jgi:hypothetical protein